uniref:Cytochrome c oxidase assembly protein COX15 n=1 Tax=Arcella intermedia TaxID=1963864 RepID=A0A6B2L3R3_9EUKA
MGVAPLRAPTKSVAQQSNAGQLRWSHSVSKVSSWKALSHKGVGNGLNSVLVVSAPNPTALWKQMGHLHYLKVPLRSLQTTVPQEEENKDKPTHNVGANRAIGIWLIICCGLIFIMVVLGGVTRLTESGLSITDWRPVTGIIPPLNQQDWIEEFVKYKSSPEFKQLNAHMELEDFKQIFWMEWGHRFMGRFIGFAFGLPLTYFALKGHLNPSLKKSLVAFFFLGGMQGFIGWWMVKSGLEEGQDHPRVSQYRLALHLGSAFAIYLGLLWTGLGLLSPVTKVNALKGIPKTLKHGAHAIAGLTFLTAMSGAFVAGLDAGLLYPELPYMGNGLVPEEYWDLQPAYKNFFDNGSAVQFNHRVLATTTWTSVFLFWLYGRRVIAAKALGGQDTTFLSRPLNSLFWMANLQVLLGITTLMYYVPTHLAATHQAGSLTLLTIATWLMHRIKLLK